MNLWLQITAGQGPAECQWVVAQVVEALHREADERNLAYHLLEDVPGDEKNTSKSVLIALEGADLEMFVRSWAGTVQWIGKSPFRPNHRRKNWYVGVEIYKPSEQVRWSEADLRIETMRSSGPGGQHVNKTSSSVRVTHLPTGIAVVGREERSQHQNRRLALARLEQLLADRQADAEGRVRQLRWSQHGELERGNPVRVYEGQNFRPRKKKAIAGNHTERMP